MGGAYQMFPALLDVLDEVEDAFPEGGGVAKGRSPDALWDGMERFSAGWFNNFLVQEWVPAMPDVEAKLEAGARMADVGCGRGRALITLVRAFPQSRFVPGRPRDIPDEARAWPVALACQKPKALGYPEELWTTRRLAAHAREHCVEAGHPSLAKLSRGTVSKIPVDNRLQPHKVTYYLEGRDPDFDRKMAELLHVLPGCRRDRRRRTRLRSGPASGILVRRDLRDQLRRPDDLDVSTAEVIRVPGDEIIHFGLRRAGRLHGVFEVRPAHRHRRHL